MDSHNYNTRKNLVVLELLDDLDYLVYLKKFTTHYVCYWQKYFFLKESACERKRHNFMTTFNKITHLAFLAPLDLLVFPANQLQVVQVDLKILNVLDKVLIASWNREWNFLWITFWTSWAHRSFNAKSFESFITFFSSVSFGTWWSKRTRRARYARIATFSLQSRWTDFSCKIRVISSFLKPSVDMNNWLKKK